MAITITTNSHTPEQASQKWCPFARLVPQMTVAPPEDMIGAKPRLMPGHPGNAFVQENGAPPFMVPCISHKCMMWQWAVTPELDTSTGEFTRGYCGLVNQ